MPPSPSPPPKIWPPEGYHQRPGGSISPIDRGRAYTFSPSYDPVPVAPEPSQQEKEINRLKEVIRNLKKNQKPKAKKKKHLHEKWKRLFCKHTLQYANNPLGAPTQDIRDKSCMSETFKQAMEIRNEFVKKIVPLIEIIKTEN